MDDIHLKILDKITIAYLGMCSSKNLFRLKDPTLKTTIMTTKIDDNDSIDNLATMHCNGDKVQNSLFDDLTFFGMQNATLSWLSCSIM